MFVWLWVFLVDKMIKVEKSGQALMMSILLKAHLMRNTVRFLSLEAFLPLVLSSTSSQMTKNVEGQPLTFPNSFANW